MDQSSRIERFAGAARRRHGTRMQELRRAVLKRTRAEVEQMGGRWPKDAPAAADALFADRSPSSRAYYRRVASECIAEPKQKGGRVFHVEITGDFDDDLAGAAIAETEKQLTERARAYNCPSHGRSTRAQVSLNRETDELEFSGMCCEPAVEALMLSVAEVVEDEDDVEDSE